MKTVRKVSLQNSVIQDVLSERQRQDAKWGEQNHEDFIWLAILTEEVGEAAQAALHDEFGGKAEGTLRAELVQLAAVAIGWLECINRRAPAFKGVCPACGGKDFAGYSAGPDDKDVIAECNDCGHTEVVA